MRRSLALACELPPWQEFCSSCVGGGGLGAFHHAGSGVSGTFAYSDAFLDGVVNLTADYGEALVQGEPLGFSFTAVHARVTVVHVRQAAIDNPLASDLFVKTAEWRDNYSFEGFIARLGPSPAAVIYAYNTPGAGRFVLPLQRVDASPLSPTTEKYDFLLGDRGQTYAFEHALDPPDFGVAQGGLKGPFLHDVPSWSYAGNVTVAFDVANVTVEDSTQHIDIRTGEWTSTPVEGAPVYERERAYAVVQAEGADIHVVPGSTSARFLSPSPEYHTNGTVTFHGAKGDLDVPSGHAGVHEGVVQVVGNITIRPHATNQIGLLSLSRRVTTNADFSGNADSVMVDGRVILAARPVLEDASLLAAVLGIVVLAWSTLQKSAAILLFPLYSRLTGKQVLENGNRLAVLRIVGATPFIHVRELQRRTGLGFGCVVYHLAVLRREHLIHSCKVGKEEHFFRLQGGFTVAEMSRLSLLAEAGRRAMAERVVREGGAAQGDLVRQLRMNQALVSRHADQLIAAGLIVRSSGRAARYTATPLLRKWLTAPVPVPPGVSCKANAAAS